MRFSVAIDVVLGQWDPGLRVPQTPACEYDLVIVSGGGFFDFREKLVASKKATGVSISAADEGKAITVSQVTRLVETAIKAGMPGSLLVRGEVSNFSANRGSGHAYFSLKDGSSILNCVMFKSEFSRVKFVPEDGMELLAGGSVRVYAASGRYQLYVNSLAAFGKRRAGIGVSADAGEAGSRGIIFGRNERSLFLLILRK